MLSQENQITIIGAGPAGCYLGQLLKKAGFDPLIIEEHKQVGSPVACAGVVSKEVFEDLKFTLSKDSILNVLNGAVINFNGQSFNIFREKAAYVIDREIFDRSLSANLNIQLGTKLISFQKIDSQYLLRTAKGDFLTSFLIGADGPSSTVRKYAGLAQKINFVKGLQFRFKLTQQMFPLDLVQIFLIRPFSCFAWVVPEEKLVVRVGVISPKPIDNLKEIIKSKNIRGKILQKIGGIIPLGLIPTVKQNIALLGDAASQVKPLSCGGIYYGLKSAEFLASSIIENKLAAYDKKWKKQFSREISIGLVARKIFEKTSLSILNDLYNLVKENAKNVEKFGDFEKHSKVIRTFLKNPRTYKVMGKVLWDLLKKF